MEENTGSESGGLDTTVSNDMFAGSDIESTMSEAFDSQQDAPDQLRGNDGKYISKDTPDKTSEEVYDDTTPSDDTEADNDTQDNTDTDESAQEHTTPKRDVPIGWDKDKSAEWESMNESQQDQFIKRNNQFSAKIQQSVEGKKFADQIRQVEAPYQAMIQSEGADTISAYRDYLKTAYQLRNGSPEQKSQIVADLARTFNVPMQGAQNQGQQEDIYVDPEIQALQATITAQNNRLAQIEQRATQQDQLSQMSEDHSIDNEITTFSKAEGHEHFDSVRTTMGALMSNGIAENLEDAYQQAIYANPSTREKVMSAQKSSSATQRTMDAQAETDKAEKTAGTNLRSKGGGGKKIVAKSMDQTMEDAYDRAMNR